MFYSTGCSFTFRRRRGTVWPARLQAVDHCPVRPLLLLPRPARRYISPHITTMKTFTYCCRGVGLVPRWYYTSMIPQEKMTSLFGIGTLEWNFRSVLPHHPKVCKSKKGSRLWAHTALLCWAVCTRCPTSFPNSCQLQRSCHRLSFPTCFQQKPAKMDQASRSNVTSGTSQGRPLGAGLVIGPIRADSCCRRVYAVKCCNASDHCWSLRVASLKETDKGVDDGGDVSACLLKPVDLFRP